MAAERQWQTATWRDSKIERPKVLFGVQPRDPLTLASIGVLMLTVAAIASFLPAWRAARIEPMAALRDE